MFETLIGNEEIKALLQRLFEKGRMPNSMILAGAEGVGKRQFAVELARAIVCREGTACGKCVACLRAGAFAQPKPDDKDAFKRLVYSEHPDVAMVLPYNRNILVDAIREIEREAYFRPYEAAARIFIIDDAHKMNDAAANALLKTLEEPAATSHIILITSRPDALLQTIRSRCQMIRFAPVESDLIKQHLMEQGSSREDAEVIACGSGGSVGAALSMDAEAFRNERAMMLEILNSLALDGGDATLLAAAEKMSDARNKDNYERGLGILASLIRDGLVLNVGGEKIENADLRNDLRQAAGAVKNAKLSRWIVEIEEAIASLEVNVNKKVTTDALFLKMAA